jgi:hypothetical protein
MNAAPIYLLRGDATDGPYDYEDIELMIGEKEIAPEMLSSVEGMPGWRSVPETMVWSQAVFLKGILDVAKDVSARIGANKLDLRYGRVELKKALMHKNVLTANIDTLGTVAETNGLLARMHAQFLQQDQCWSPDVFDFFPALELLPFGPQKFPRDWLAVWQQAGGKIYGGKMVARKDDPVWSAISDFGFPFPPFSFDFNLWIESVDINAAEKLGVPDLSRKISLPEISPLRFVGIAPE